jgi:hypothetical protein
MRSVLSLISKSILQHTTHTLAFLVFTLFMVWLSAREAIVFYAMSYCNLTWSVWDKCTVYTYTIIILNCHGNPKLLRNIGKSISVGSSHIEGGVEYGTSFASSKEN